MVKEVLMFMGQIASSGIDVYECPNGSTATVLYIRALNNLDADISIGIHLVKAGASETLGMSNAIIGETVPMAGTGYGSKEYRVFVPMSEGDRIFATSSSVVATTFLITGMLRS